MSKERVPDYEDAREKSDDFSRKDQTNFENKKLLIDLINCEVTQIESEIKRPGWTSWAFLGALATLIWLLVNQAPFGNINWQNIGLLFLTMTVTVEFVKGLPALFSKQRSNTSKEPRFFHTSTFGDTRFSLFVWLIHTSLLFFIAIRLGQSILVISKISLLILLGFYIYVLIIAIILSFRNIPQSRLQKGKIWSITLITIAVLYLVSLIGYWNTLIYNISVFEQLNIKAAVLLVLIAYVLILMAESGIIPPMLTSLISIRRDLILDKMDVNLATRQTDIAFSGLKVEDILQEYVKEILDCFDVININIKQIAQISRAIEDLYFDLKTAPDKEKFNSLHKAIEALNSARHQHVDNILPLQDKFTEAMRKYKMKADQIIRANRQTTTAVEEVTRKIEIARKETLDLFAVLDEQKSKLAAKLDAMRASYEVKS